MHRKAVVRILLALFFLAIICLPGLHWFIRIVLAYFMGLRFLTIVSFSYSGCCFEPDGIILFTRCFKRFRHHASDISKIEFSELGFWIKMSFSGKIVAPVWTYPVMSFFINDDGGRMLKYKVFVNTFDEDGEALVAFLENLRKLNPTLIIPDVKAYNETLNY